MRERVIAYLVRHYGISKIEAAKLTDGWSNFIRDAELMGSEPYYPAGLIADAEVLKHLDPCPQCEHESCH